MDKLARKAIRDRVAPRRQHLPCNPEDGPILRLQSIPRKNGKLDWEGMDRRASVYRLSNARV